MQSFCLSESEQLGKKSLRHTHKLPGQCLWWRSTAGNIWMYFRSVYISKTLKNYTERERQHSEKHCRCQKGNKVKAQIEDCLKSITHIRSQPVPNSSYCHNPSPTITDICCNNWQTAASPSNFCPTSVVLANENRDFVHGLSAYQPLTTPLTHHADTLQKQLRFHLTSFKWRKH